MRYTVKQVAEMWGVSPHTVYNLIDRRALSCVRIGRAVRLRDEDITEYEERSCRAANDNHHTYGGIAATATGTSSRAMGDVFQLARRIKGKPL